MTEAKRFKMTDADISKCINTIRCLAADTVQGAKSGHPGAPMGCAPMATALWGEVMNFDAEAPKWANRDRFVLSNGHACALQYCMLHLAGYPLSIDDLKQFRQVGSLTPGHPENHITAGIEVSTGPLGQGISNAVGLAIAEAHLAATYNRPGFDVVDHFTYVICGDGCLQEGVSAEAGSLAGHLKLGKIIVLYDDNNIQIDGGTDLAFSEDVLKRYEAYGWHTQTVADGDGPDISAILAAIEVAKGVTDAPSMMKVRTTIGKGSAKENTAKGHGAPLGPEDLANLKTKFGLDPAASYAVEDDVYAYFRTRTSAGKEKHAAWNAMFDEYAAAHPELAAQFTRTQAGELPAGWDAALPAAAPGDKALATRKSSQAALAAIVPQLPELIGGSADLTPSNLTKVEGNAVDFQPGSYDGRYLRFGVREHAMASICNGLAAHGGLIPFGATFLTFVGYAVGAMRLSALSCFRVVYVMTHDSIGLGEDGPTHQPIETLASLRSMPNMCVIRPADQNEVSGAYACALANAHGPTTLALSRQGCAVLEGSSAAAVSKGAYALKDTAGAKLILVATGSEVQLAVSTLPALAEAGISAAVVSMPSWELFEAQPVEYRQSVFPAGTPVLSIEAACTWGWERYAHASIGVNSFGMSGPGPKVFEHFGFTGENIVAKAKATVDFYGDSAPNLVARPF